MCPLAGYIAIGYYRRKRDENECDVEAYSPQQQQPKSHILLDFMEWEIHSPQSQHIKKNWIWWNNGFDGHIGCVASLYYIIVFCLRLCFI